MKSKTELLSSYGQRKSSHSLKVGYQDYRTNTSPHELIRDPITRLEKSGSEQSGL